IQKHFCVKLSTRQLTLIALSLPSSCHERDYPRIPYTTLFRATITGPLVPQAIGGGENAVIAGIVAVLTVLTLLYFQFTGRQNARSEEHTSELQSRENLVCRL